MLLLERSLDEIRDFLIKVLDKIDSTKSIHDVILFKRYDVFELLLEFGANPDSLLSGKYSIYDYWNSGENKIIRKIVEKYE